MTNFLEIKHKRTLGEMLFLYKEMKAKREKAEDLNGQSFIGPHADALAEVAETLFELELARLADVPLAQYEEEYARALLNLYAFLAISAVWLDGVDKELRGVYLKAFRALDEKYDKDYCRGDIVLNEKNPCGIYREFADLCSSDIAKSETQTGGSI